MRSVLVKLRNAALAATATGISSTKTSTTTNNSNSNNEHTGIFDQRRDQPGADREDTDESPNNNNKVVVSADTDRNTDVSNPPPDKRLEAGDNMLASSHNSSSVHFVDDTTEDEGGLVGRRIVVAGEGGVSETGGVVRFEGRQQGMTAIPHYQQNPGPCVPVEHKSSLPRRTSSPNAVDTKTPSAIVETVQPLRRDSNINASRRKSSEKRVHEPRAVFVHRASLTEISGEDRESGKEFSST